MYRSIAGWSDNGTDIAMFRDGFWNRSLRRVAHRLDVMAIGVEHKSAVVIGVIVGADAGRAIVAPAGCDPRLVECIDRGAVLCQDRDVERLVQSAFAADPEIRL